MADIRCRNCQEPWDSYGVLHEEDMTKEEKELFLQGKGCPSCNFGQKKQTLLADAVAVENLEGFILELDEVTDDDTVMEFLEELYFGGE